MPTDLSGWMWWFFTAIVLATVLGVGVNLFTPKVKEAGEGWFQKRRLKKESYRKQIEAMSRRLDDSPSEVYLYLLTKLSGYGVAFVFATGVIVATVIVVFLFNLDMVKIINAPTYFKPLLSVFFAVGTGIIFMYTYFKILSVVRMIADIYSVYNKKKREIRVAMREAQKAEVETP